MVAVAKSYLCSASLWKASPGSRLPEFCISQKVLTISTLKKGIQKDRIRDAVKNGNHAADMQQDDACIENAEDGKSSQIEMMLRDEYQSASSSKKLKSFHYKDDKAAGLAMEHGHGNDSVTEQQRVALNSQYNIFWN